MPDQPNCSFCIKSAPDVDKLIAGPGIYICNECVTLCTEILATPSPPSDPPSVVAWDSLTDDKLLEGLPRVAAVSSQVEASLNEWVKELRGRGVTWTRIGEALGMTRQSAWGRFSLEQ